MQISAKVLRVVQGEQISPDELYRMLGELAFTSLRGCNRRYFQWLFRVEGDVVLDMQRLDLVEVGRGRDRMLEEHEPCDGEGCRVCGWAGHILRGVDDSTAQAMHAAR